MALQPQLLEISDVEKLSEADNNQRCLKQASLLLETSAVLSISAALPPVGRKSGVV